MWYVCDGGGRLKLSPRVSLGSTPSECRRKKIYCTIHFSIFPTLTPWKYDDACDRCHYTILLVRVIAGNAHRGGSRRRSKIVGWSTSQSRENRLVPRFSDHNIPRVPRYTYRSEST